jgi:hypothetical protein
MSGQARCPWKPHFYIELSDIKLHYYSIVKTLNGRSVFGARRPEEHVMQPAKHPEPALLPLLLAWASHRLEVLMAALKPRYSAAAISAHVAGDGNPAGG